MLVHILAVPEPPATPPPLQEFTFVVSPTGHSQHLKLVLLAPSEQGQQYVAAGSLGLDSLLESDTPRHRVSVPVVDEVRRMGARG